MERQKVVLVGGGHAHALVLQAFRPNDLSGVELVVIEPHHKAPYTGMLPGYVAGHYLADELYVDIAKLVDKAGGTFVAKKATHIDPDHQIVYTEEEQYSYDVLSIDIGIHAAMPDIPGFTEHAVGVKPLGEFADRWQGLCEAASQDTPEHVVIIGGGVAGVEVALAAKHRLDTLGSSGSTVTILDQDLLLRSVSDRTRTYLLDELHRQGVKTTENVQVSEIRKGSISLGTETLPATFVLGAAGARPYSWLEDSCLPLQDGFIKVDAALRSSKYLNVFAVGDCAHFAPQPLQKAGVYAVRQAPVLRHNILALLNGVQLEEYKPQNDYLKLISLGGKRAAADKWGVCLRGRALWQLKNRIDKSFMSSLD